MHHPTDRIAHTTDRIAHTTAFATPIVDHWLEREIDVLIEPMDNFLGPRFPKYVTKCFDCSIDWVSDHYYVLYGFGCSETNRKPVENNK